MDATKDVEVWECVTVGEIENEDCRKRRPANPGQAEIINDELKLSLLLRCARGSCKQGQFQIGLALRVLAALALPIEIPRRPRRTRYFGIRSVARSTSVGMSDEALFSSSGFSSQWPMLDWDRAETELS